MIHVVFQHADVSVLQKAIELDETLTGDIFEIKDDYAVGPLKELYTEEGWMARQEWWSMLLQDTPYESQQLVGSFDDRKTVTEIKSRLENDEHEQLWIWAGQNAHDVCGYYWLVAQLKEYQGKIVILYLNNLPFINDKGQIFYPTALHQILPKEFLKAKKLNRKITSSEFEVDPDEWNKITDESSLVRILEGGKKIVSKGEDYYDSDIIGNVSNEWQKGNKTIQNILAKMKIKTGDVYLLWRIKNLVNEGKLEMNGTPGKGWKEFEVRSKTVTPETTEVNSTEPI